MKATVGSEHISSNPRTKPPASQETPKAEKPVSKRFKTEEVLGRFSAESDMVDTDDVKVSDLALPSDPGAIAISHPSVQGCWQKAPIPSLRRWVLSFSERCTRILIIS